MQHKNAQKKREAKKITAQLQDILYVKVNHQFVNIFDRFGAEFFCLFFTALNTLTHTRIRNRDFALNNGIKANGGKKENLQLNVNNFWRGKKP